MRQMRETSLDAIGRAFPNLVAGAGWVSTSTFSVVHFNINVIKDRLPSARWLQGFLCTRGASKYLICVGSIHRAHTV